MSEIETQTEVDPIETILEGQASSYHSVHRLDTNVADML